MSMSAARLRAVDRRRGHVGWTKAGIIVLRLAWKGLVPYCFTCKKERPKGHVPYCRSTNCSTPFYDRYYRAWHITRRVVRARNVGYWCAGFLRRRHRPPENEMLEYDHILEIAAGGDPLDPANVQMLCKKCHREKTRHFLSTKGPTHPLMPPPHVRPLEVYA